MAELDLLAWITQGPRLLAREVPFEADSIDWLQAELPLAVSPSVGRMANGTLACAADPVGGLSVA